MPPHTAGGCRRSSRRPQGHKRTKQLTWTPQPPGLARVGRRHAHERLLLAHGDGSGDLAQAHRATGAAQQQEVAAARRMRERRCTQQGAACHVNACLHWKCHGGCCHSALKPMNRCKTPAACAEDNCAAAADTLATLRGDQNDFNSLLGHLHGTCWCRRPCARRQAGRRPAGRVSHPRGSAPRPAPNASAGPLRPCNTQGV